MNPMLVFLPFLALVAPPERRPMTIDDALRMVRVGDVAISPEGDAIFYSERRLH